MNALRKSLCLLLLTVSFSSNAIADDNLWIGAKVGTLGIGIEATWHAIEWCDIRVGYNRYDYKDTGSQAGVNYDGTLRLDTLYATANLRFPLSPIRLTVGTYSNKNKLILTSQDAPSFDIGGVTYTSADVGTLRSEISFDSSSPYLGVGFDFEIFNKMGLNLDFGVLLQGDPRVTLTSDGLLASNPAYLATLESERQQLEAEVEDLKAWPVVSIGLSFNF